jgi:hypothetical protein
MQLRERETLLVVSQQILMHLVRLVPKDVVKLRAQLWSKYTRLVRLIYIIQHPVQRKVMYSNMPTHHHSVIV